VLRARSYHYEHPHAQSSTGSSWPPLALPHEHTFRTATAAGGLNPFLLPHGEHPRARLRGCTPTPAAHAQGARHAPRRRPAGGRHRALETGACRSTPTCWWVGGGIAGIHAALTLANAGKKVYLVEREATIGGYMAQFRQDIPTLDCAACILTPKMSSVKAHPNITLWTYADCDHGWTGTSATSTWR